MRQQDSQCNQGFYAQHLGANTYGLVAVHMLQPAASWRYHMWTVIRPDAL